MKNIDLDNIPASQFEFAQLDAKIHDKKFETKPVGYFADAWGRFKKNKASLVGAIIILVIALFAVIYPFVSPYEISTNNGVYVKIRPRIDSMAKTGFMDGGYEKKLNDRYIIYYTGIGAASEYYDNPTVSFADAQKAEFSPIIKIGDEYTAGGRSYRNTKVDSCLENGFVYMSVTKERFDEIRALEEKLGIHIIYPMVDINSPDCADPSDANMWYKVGPSNYPLDAEGNELKLSQVEKVGFTDNYLRDENGEVQYSLKKDKTMLQIRVLYYNYYTATTGNPPTFLFGTDAQGYDIMTRLAYGIRLSLLLSISVSLLNLLIGTVYGAIEGFYGGWVDMVMERISDILNGIPFIIVATLFNLHLVKTGQVSPFVGILLAFVLTGWLGIASRVRTQFYRFKNQEYVLAARTLGAKDRRLMFKHILPNALGTIITTSVLIIPSTILSESILSYLGIFNFNSQNTTSLGTLLGNGNGYLATDPHIILLPALVISLLMISFNLFGNGLRDAFNPSLRGVDE